MTTSTREEAVGLVNEALSANAKTFVPMAERGDSSTYSPTVRAELAREKFLGSAIVELYQKTKERMPGPNPAKNEKIARRMKSTAGLLSEIYDSTTCSPAVRDKIDAVAQQERDETAAPRF